MATTTIPTFETVTDRVLESGDRALDASRKLTNTYLDSIERYVSGLVKLERRLGAQTEVEPLASLFAASADLTEEVTKAGVTAARELVAA
jgi:hypothetical protein